MPNLKEANRHSLWMSYGQSSLAKNLERSKLASDANREKKSPGDAYVFNQAEMAFIWLALSDR